MQVGAATEVSYDKSLVSASSPIHKRIPDADKNGNDASFDEIQIRIEGIADAPLDNLRASVQYYGKESQFLGADFDSHIGLLEPGKVWVANIVTDIPPEASAVKIDISCRRYGARARLERLLVTPYGVVLFALAVVLFAKLVKSFF